MENESLEQKQRYLRENILEKGYDPDKFMDYLTMKKGEEGINLERWSLQELIQVKEEFLENNPIEPKSYIDCSIQIAQYEEEEEKEEKEEMEEKSNEEIIKEEKKIEDIIPNSVNYFVDCNRFDDTPITNMKETIGIEVTKPKVEKGGFFSFSHSTYLIVVPKLNFQVRRKFTDFVWLYNILKVQYPYCIIPPILKKKENLDKIKMNNYIYYLEKFLNGVAIHPILRTSAIFYEFLSLQDEKDFVKSKKKYEKMARPLNIVDFKTKDGKIRAKIDSQNEVNYDKIKSKLISQEILYEKLIYNYKLLLIDISQTAVKMKEITDIWAELYNLKKDYMESNFTSRVYKSYIKIMNNWTILQGNYCRLIKSSITKFFKFIKEEYNAFKDLSYIVDNNKNIFSKKYNKLIDKENCFTKSMISKDEKERGEVENQFKKFKEGFVNKVDEIGKDYGCFLNIYVDEYERLRDLNDIRFQENLSSFIKDLLGQLAGYSNKLGEALSFIDKSK